MFTFDKLHLQLGLFHPAFAWLALGVSLAATAWLVWSSHHHSHLSSDHDLDGPQKFHALPVPRIGGVGVAMGVLAGVVGLQWWSGHDQITDYAWMLLCATPAFFAGLIEDLTKRVTAKSRLVATMLAALMAGVLMEAWIPVNRVEGLAWLIGYWPLAWAFTLLAVGGVANAVNIIDGFNGLASMCTALMFVTIAFVAHQVGDAFVGGMALLCLGGVLGFFSLNFPAGLIFLGDGGSYFLGFMVAELSLLLTARNDAVSPYFALLVCAYPVFETVFSIYRRKVVRGVPSMAPDGIHLHSLIFRRLVRRLMPSEATSRDLTLRNSMTAPYLWVLCAMSLFPAALFWNSAPWLIASCLVFASTYVYLYARIVHFKTPQWLVRLTPSGQRRVGG